MPILSLMRFSFQRAPRESPLPDGEIGNGAARRDTNPRIAIALLATFVLQISLGWLLLGTLPRLIATNASTFREVHLQAHVEVLDEILTNSVRLAVATGDESWVARYQAHETELEAVILEIRELSDPGLDSALADRVEVVNDALVALEHRAIALVEAGDADSAHAILESQTYSDSKAEFADSVFRMHGVLSDIVDNAAARARIELVLVGVLAALVSVIAALGWWRAIAGFRRVVRDRETAREWLGTAVEASNIGIWNWRIGERRIEHNRQYMQMLGMAPGEGSSPDSLFFERLHPEDLQRKVDAVRRCHDRVDPEYDLEVRLRCADGSYRWVRSRGRVVEWDARGEPIRMTGVHIDIDDQKRVQAELEQARAAAEAASEAKSCFLANMSHELRTPLTSIIGFSDILCDDETPPDETRKGVEIISNNARHLLTLINDILDLSKIESNHVELAPVPCRPERFGKDLRTMLACVAHNKGITFEVEIERPNANVVVLDQVRVRQILLNLASNAVKFTSEGGVRVVISCRPDDTGRAAFVVQVHDTGIGMDEGCLSRIFRPFIQGEVSSTRRFGGTGLGLSISNGLAQMMGGGIEALSEPGHGSSFTLTIPLESDQFEMRQDSPPPSESPGSPDALAQRPDLTGARILLIEDGPDNQRLIQTFLQRDGATVVIASDGRAGVDVIEAVRDDDDAFDLVLMDMQMPVLDGYGATRRLRASGFAHPIIALTAYATSGDRARCLEAGCDDFLTKPISRADLARSCADWIRKRRQRAARAA